GNGFGNRFLWVCSRRSKCLPDGGDLRDEDLKPLAERVADAVRWSAQMDRIMRAPMAGDIWDTVYPSLSEGRPGLLGAMVSRAEAQVMRLAMIYMLLDGAERVERDHLLAALAVWDFCEASARFIFGDALGDPIADELLAYLRQDTHGRTRSQIRDLY